MELGIVIPCYNEEAVLGHLLDELARFRKEQPFSVKCLFVNDGSRDATASMLDKACETEPAYACVHLSRNFGHQSAVTAGLKHICGDAVVIIDADLQDPLDVIPAMVEKWKEGFEVVYGVRQNRQESLLLRGCYAFFYRLLRRISQVDIPLDSGDFSLLDRRVVDCLNALPEKRRFVRGLRAWAGFRQTGVPYNRQGRRAGTSKYSLIRLMQLAVNGIISFSSAPLRLATWLGLAFSSLAFLLLIWAVVAALFFKNTPSGWASLVVLFVFFGGIQLLVLGILGEYISQIVDEVKARPTFLVARQGGWVANKD